MTIYVEKVKNRIHLEGWAGPETPTKCKRIIGANARWDKTGVRDKFLGWSYPLDYTACLQMREQFGPNLVIGPDLLAWAKVERKKRDSLIKIVKSEAFDLPAVTALAPRLAGAMAARTYQQVGSAFLHRAQRGIIADEPGLGKTLQIMGAVLEAGLTGPILVMAPSAAIQITWPHELKQWLPDDNVYMAVGNRKQREDVLWNFQKGVEARPSERHWLLVNFEMARAVQVPTKVSGEPGPFAWSHKDKRTGKTTKGVWHHPYSDLFFRDWSAIIADESQRALITTTPVKTDQSQARAGAGMLRIREGGLRIAASGTPFRGKKENLWGTLNWIRPEVYTSYWNWVKANFETFDDGHTLIIGDLLPHREESFYKELDAVMIRRKKLEVVPDLPPKQYMGAPLDPSDPESLHGIWLDMDPKQTKAYDEIVENAAANLESGTLLATGVLAELTRLKQFSTCYGDLESRVYKGEDGFLEEAFDFVPRLPSNKFNWLVDWLDERGHFTGEDEGKVIIASQFTQIINLFSAELEKMGCPVHKLTGETKAKDRIRAKEAFQAEGGPRVFFLNTDAGGVSLTLDAADDLIFLDEKWIPDDQEQVEDRAHRVSRMHQVRIWYLRSLGGIEEQIARVNEDRDAMQKTLLDGRRGVDFAKVLIKSEAA
jgi:SNF2 family DNA or RNA helicase